jgi:hypothetical protein
MTKDNNNENVGFFKEINTRDISVMVSEATDN